MREHCGCTYEFVWGWKLDPNSSATPVATGGTGGKLATVLRRRCPMHKAAPTMLAALEKLLSPNPVWHGPGRELARKAIAAARSEPAQQPQDGGS